MDIGDYISEFLVWIQQTLGIPVPQWVEEGLRGIDLDLVYWLVRLFAPIIITFLLPFLLLIFIYGSILFLHIYKRRHVLVEAYVNKGFWDGARKTLAIFWDGHGKIWHGFKLLLQVFQVTPGTVEEITRVLQDGKLVAIAPGGVREAQFSTSNYEIIWGKRSGFARSALAAKVPIIPIFTQNLREAFRTIDVGRGYLREVYERTRLPLVPIYGGFPVKLRTFIGDPIPYDPTITPEELASKTLIALDKLIKKHQRIPGSIFFALLDRLSPRVSANNQRR